MILGYGRPSLPQGWLMVDTSIMSGLSRTAGVAVLLLSAILACTADVVLVPAQPSATDDSTATDTTGTDTTIVQRATLTVTASVDPQDAAIAAQLGWTGGILAGATVTARRGFTTFTDTTDALGQATFAEILPGTYQVSVLRALTDAERALLPAEQGGLTAFGGGAQVTVTPPTTAVTVTTRATRRGSLVISELFPSSWLGDQHYYFGGFVELYNNSDTTIYLDGKLFGYGPFFHIDAPEYDRPCSLTQQWQADPEGLWAGIVWRLPGSGRQYPLAPREAAVLAADAVDHRLVDARWPDLSGARFEFLGAADVDNPAAANLTIVGTPYATDLLGHGPYGWSGIKFIADTVDVASLPTVQPPNYRVPIPRIPREKILDVVYFESHPAFWEEYPQFVLCPVLISPVFDAGPAFWYDEVAFVSWRRRAAGPFLLRSGSTVNDFEIIAAPTPGIVP